MKRFATAVLCLSLMAAACGDDDAADPASLDSCQGLAGAGVSLLQDTIDLIDGLDAAALASFAKPTGLPHNSLKQSRKGKYRQDGIFGGSRIIPFGMSIDPGVPIPMAAISFNVSDSPDNIASIASRVRCIAASAPRGSSVGTELRASVRP